MDKLRVRVSTDVLYHLCCDGYVQTTKNCSGLMHANGKPYFVAE